MKIYKLKHYGSAPIPKSNTLTQDLRNPYSKLNREGIIKDFEEIEQVSLTDWEKDFYFPKDKEY